MTQQKAERMLTQRQAAEEVYRREKTLKTLSIFNVVAIFLSGVTWSMSTAVGAVVICLGIAYNAYILNKAQNMLKYLRERYAVK